MSLPLATKGTLHGGVTTATKGMIWYGLYKEVISLLVHPDLIFRKGVLSRIFRHAIVNRIFKHDNID